MAGINIKASSDNFDERKHILAGNRTGGTLARRSVAALDTAQGDGDADNATDGRGNVVACATANLSKLLVVLLDEALADDALGKFALVDPDVEVLVDGTTDVAAGGYLIAQNGEVDLVA